MILPGDRTDNIGDFLWLNTSGKKILSDVKTDIGTSLINYLNFEFQHYYLMSVLTFLFVF